MGECEVLRGCLEIVRDYGEIGGIVRDYGGTQGIMGEYEGL